MTISGRLSGTSETVTPSAPSAPPASVPTRTRSVPTPAAPTSTDSSGSAAAVPRTAKPAPADELEDEVAETTGELRGVDDQGRCEPPARGRRRRLTPSVSGRVPGGRRPAGRQQAGGGVDQPGTTVARSPAACSSHAFGSLTRPDGQVTRA